METRCGRDRCPHTLENVGIREPRVIRVEVKSAER
jgi:hypothetical protein